MGGKVGRSIVAVVLALAAAVALPSAAGAGAPQCTGYPEPTLTPTEGPTGTVVTIAAGPDTSDCVPTPVPIEGTDAFVTVGLAMRTPEDSALAATQIADDGSWSTTWTVPDDQPVGDVTLYATAWYDPGIGVANGVDVTARGSGFEYPSIDYQPLTFTVTAPPPSTTSSSTTSSTVPEASIRVSDDQLLPGEGFTVYGSGFQPGSAVEVWLESTPVLLGTAVADAVGNVQAEVAVPAGFEAGPHTVRLVGTGIGGGVLNLSVGVTVGALVGDAGPAVEATPAAAGELPRTGGVPLGTLVVATGLLLAGTLVLRLRTGARARARARS